MRPSFFGDSDRQLLGIHHPPKGQPDRGTGVVLCYPGVQEYMHAHWAFRNLAQLLSKQGFHAFRFDYSGTGDSAGELSDGWLERWTQDIQTAAAELKDLSGVRRLSLVGMRLGAALAARAARAIKVDALVLWEPVVSGQEYVSELRVIQKSRFAESLFPPGPPSEGRFDELLGFPFPRSTEAAVEQLDLLALSPWPAARTAVVVSEPRPSYQMLRDQLGAAGVPLDFRHLTEEGRAREQLEGSMLSNKLLQSIASALAGDRA